MMHTQTASDSPFYTTCKCIVISTTNTFGAKNVLSTSGLALSLCRLISR